MTPTDFRSALQTLGLTQAEASAVLGVATRTLRSWMTGERAIPEPVARLVRLILSGRLSCAEVENA